MDLNAVGKSVRGSVNMSRGGVTPSPNKKKTPRSGALKRTPVEPIPGSPPAGMSRRGMIGIMKGEVDDENDSDLDSGVVSPSSAVSMSPRLEALQ